MTQEEPIESFTFEDFFNRSERALRYALCARYGFEVGQEATADALAYAWEHWGRIGDMKNPAGYVYRVGQRLGWRLAKKTRPVDFRRSDSEMPLIEPQLRPALARLSARQRAVVLLVHALGWTHRETAEFLGLSSSTVQKHAERGMSKLRQQLGVDVEH